MFSDTKKDINFLDAYFLKESKPSFSVKTSAVIMGIVILVLVTVSGTIFGLQQITKADNAKIEKEIKSLEGIENTIKEVRHEQQQLKIKNEIKSRSVKANDLDYNMLTIFEQVLTSDMSIDNMSIEYDKISFTVKGDKEENFAQLINNMESSGLFGNIQIKDVSAKDADGKRKASINADVVRKW